MLRASITTRGLRALTGLLAFPAYGPVGAEINSSPGLDSTALCFVA